MSEKHGSQVPTLARTMGLGALVIYGVGDMLGSGIYALMGRAAGEMGNAIWLAFLTSMVAALLTGLSYASLGSRYPRAAGAAYVTHRAYGMAFLSYMVGLAVMASGITSMATQSRAFTGYVDRLVAGTPAWVVILCFIGALTLVNFWGMRESTWLNIVCTAVEVGGIAIVIVVGLSAWGSVNYLETPALPTGEPAPLAVPLILQGAALTFFSFIGFEDMINVVEEVKDPRRNFPRAVVIALGVVTVIYIAAAVSAVSVVPHAELAVSKEPLVEVVRRAAPAFPVLLFSGISLFAITNTALLNYIMGSRLAYGMARQGLLPAVLGAIHPTRRTPHVAIFALMLFALILALSIDLTNLARATTSLLLFVFMIVNAALIVLQRRPGEAKGQFEVPAVVPAGGILVCAALLMNQPIEALLIAGGLLTGIAALYLVMRPRAITEETLAEIED
jgi:APA family basic amino acid/polyamine antiporter